MAVLTAFSCSQELLRIYCYAACFLLYLISGNRRGAKKYGRLPVQMHSWLYFGDL